MDRLLITDVRAQQKHWGVGVSIAVGMRDQVNQKMFVITEISTQELKSGDYIPESPLQFTDTAIQELMNELWHLGYRPSNNLLPSFEATIKHLNDMRAIVSQSLGVKLP